MQYSRCVQIIVDVGFTIMHMALWYSPIVYFLNCTFHIAPPLPSWKSREQNLLMKMEYKDSETTC